MINTSETPLLIYYTDGTSSMINYGAETNIVFSIFNHCKRSKCFIH